MHVRFTMLMSRSKASSLCDVILVTPAREALPVSKSVRYSALIRRLVELIGFEPTTPCLQSRCSPN